jgi:outer membrane protein OmpA-like peptidoglycan-associated protein
MNTAPKSLKAPLAAAAIALLLAACASTPRQPDGAIALRQRLNQLQADPQLSGRAPLAMEQAEKAVSAAEQPQRDPAINAHLQFMADRKISIAEAEAHNRWSQDRLKEITEQRTAMQLSARTQEADAANRRAAAANVNAALATAAADNQRQQAELARNDAANAQNAAAEASRTTAAANLNAALATASADSQRQQAETERQRAEMARNEAADAKNAAAEAQRQAAELQQQIIIIQGKVTDRGVVLTLGDVLFASGSANLNSGGSDRLSKLAGFLKRYPERNAQIDGFTDSVGSDEFNQALSQRRADAVKSYLVNQGISASRLTANGRGESSPVGDNGTATGRQQNRRVEVLISNDLVSGL